MSHPPQIPPELLRPDIRTAIITALVRTYEVNQDRHDPRLGDTALTFGIHAWASSTHYLVEELGTA